MNFEDLSGNQLVELFGNEFMGRSLLKRVASKTVKAVKKTGGVIARNQGTIATGGLLKLAPKSVQKSVNKNFTQAAAAAATGGLSLVATKQGRNIIGSTARLAQKKIIRPVVHQAARNPLVQKALTTAVSSFVPGGAAALTAASMLKSKGHKAAAPFVQAARTAQAASPAPTVRKPVRAPAAHPTGNPPVTVHTRRPPAAPVPAAVEAPAAHAPLSMPLILGIGGVGLAGLLLAMSMGKKKG